MHIVHCFVKPQRGAEMLERPTLRLKTGQGIHGDANADSWSPRQVLLVNEEAYFDNNLPERTLRENLLITGLDLSQLKSGAVLSVGSSVALWITFPCEVCFKLNHVRSGLAKTVAHQRGVLARVLHGGTIMPGDQIVVESIRLPALPPGISSRVFGALMQVPFGRLVSFLQISRAVGVPKVYARVYPRMLKAAPSEVPVHRVVRSGGELIENHVPGQRGLLAEEGVEVDSRGSVPKEYLWGEGPFFGIEKYARSNWFRQRRVSPIQI